MRAHARWAELQIAHVVTRPVLAAILRWHDPVTLQNLSRFDPVPVTVPVTRSCILIMFLDRYYLIGTVPINHRGRKLNSGCNSGGNLKMLCVSKSRGRKKITQVKDFIASECVWQEEVGHSLA